MIVKLVELVLTGPGIERVPLALRVCAPLVSIRRLVEVAMPATAAMLVVPWSVPPPLKIDIVTLIVESAPVVTRLPKVSSTVTTGCVVRFEPAVVDAG